MRKQRYFIYNETTGKYLAGFNDMAEWDKRQFGAWIFQTREEAQKRIILMRQSGMIDKNDLVTVYP